MLSSYTFVLCTPLPKSQHPTRKNIGTPSTGLDALESNSIRSATLLTNPTLSDVYQTKKPIEILEENSRNLTRSNHDLTIPLRSVNPNHLLKVYLSFQVHSQSNHDISIIINHDTEYIYPAFWIHACMLISKRPIIDRMAALALLAKRERARYVRINLSTRTPQTNRLKLSEYETFPSNKHSPYFILSC